MEVSTKTSLNNAGFLKYMEEQEQKKSHCNENGENTKHTSRFSRPPKQDYQE